MSTRRNGRKVKTLPAKTLSKRQARAIQGGGADIFARLGDLKAESQDKRDFIEMMRWK